MKLTGQSLVALLSCRSLAAAPGIPSTLALRLWATKWLRKTEEASKPHHNFTATSFLCCEQEDPVTFLAVKEACPIHKEVQQRLQPRMQALQTYTDIDQQPLGHRLLSQSAAEPFGALQWQLLIH